MQLVQPKNVVKVTEVFYSVYIYDVIDVQHEPTNHQVARISHIQTKY